jgi:mRNA-degrading endonuclease RelE of RelBE toxin-antitoxin system
LAGNFRIRTGDYRIVFRVVGDKVIVWKIGDRKDVYLD